MAALPLDGVVNLELPESGVKYAVDWARPQLTATGIAITDALARARYESNYSRLNHRAARGVAGVAVVYTHNPWGEYGNGEHIQVHRAVMALQDELGYAIWFSNYIGRNSWRLARGLSTQVFWNERRTVAPDLPTARGLMRLYKRHGAWTWNATHRWPRHETLYGVRPHGSYEPRYSLAGEWVLDVAGLRWWPPPLRPARRRLTPGTQASAGVRA